MTGRRRGLSTIEVLMTVAILGTLLALLLPAIQAARESGRRVACGNNLRQIGLALLHHHEQFGRFPAAEPPARRPGGWATAILPLLEEQAVYDRVDLRAPVDAPANRLAAASVVPTYVCPSARTMAPDRSGATSRGYAVIDYGAMIGAVEPLAGPPVLNQAVPYPESHGVFPAADAGSSGGSPALRLADVTDGVSCTIAVGEDSGRGRQWNGVWIDGRSAFDQELPGINLTPNNELFSDHPRGVHVVLCDGSTHFLRQEIDLTVLVGLANRDDGLTLSRKEF